MIFAPELTATHNIRIVEDVRRYDWDWNESMFERGFSATEVPIDRIKVGGTSYKLFIPLNLVFSWQEEQWICWAKEFGAECMGRGKDCHESEHQWKKAVHARFQNLYQKRPFEMSEIERKDWNAFCKVIDINYYRETTPVTSREIGQVRWDKYPYPKRIQWISGRSDPIDLDKSPSEFAGYKPGQWMEAVTKRCPKTARLIEIEYAARIETIHRPAPREIERFWEEIEEADLPQSDWNWPISD